MSTMTASPSSQPARTVSVVQQKGGVGKTTSTYHLARAAHTAGNRVLVVDLDAQGNISTSLVRDVVDPDATMADVLTGDLPIDDVVTGSIWEGVDLAPTGTGLAAALDHLMAQTGREQRLRRALASVRDRYDLVLIDTPPSLGLASVSALTAADSAVLVAEPHEYSTDGLGDVAATIADVREYLNPNLDVAGILLNRVRATTTAREQIDEICRGIDVHLPGAVVWVDRQVPLWAQIADTVSAGRGLDEGGPRLRTLAERVYAPIVADLIGGGR